MDLKTQVKRLDIQQIESDDIDASIRNIKQDLMILDPLGTEPNNGCTFNAEQIRWILNAFCRDVIDSCK